MFPFLDPCRFLPHRQQPQRSSPSLSLSPPNTAVTPVPQSCQLSLASPPGRGTGGLELSRGSSVCGSGKWAREAGKARESARGLDARGCWMAGNPAPPTRRSPSRGASGLRPAPPPAANKTRGRRAAPRSVALRRGVRPGGCAGARGPAPRQAPPKSGMESRQRRRRRSHRPLVSAFLRDPGSGRVYRRGKLIGKVGGTLHPTEWGAPPIGDPNQLGLRHRAPQTGLGLGGRAQDGGGKQDLARCVCGAVGGCAGFGAVAQTGRALGVSEGSVASPLCLSVPQGERVPGPRSPRSQTRFPAAPHTCAPRPLDPRASLPRRAPSAAAIN